MIIECPNSFSQAFRHLLTASRDGSALGRPGQLAQKAFRVTCMAGQFGSNVDGHLEWCSTACHVFQRASNESRESPSLCEQLGCIYIAPLLRTALQTIAAGAGAFFLERLSGSRTHKVYTQLCQRWRSVQSNALRHLQGAAMLQHLEAARLYVSCCRCLC